MYDRFYKHGRMLPDGLCYIKSWVEKDGDRCIQLMETTDRNLIDQWILRWQDLTRFEVVEIGAKPVVQITQR